jgi:hypothetical protein
MRSKTALVMLVVVLAMLLGTLPAYGNNTNDGETKAKLETLVDNYIACCSAKSAMLASRSENIRYAAVRACMKAAYCMHSKKELVKEMLENGIEPKAYKVRRFLNRRFDGIVQAKN